MLSEVRWRQDAAPHNGQCRQKDRPFIYAPLSEAMSIVALKITDHSHEFHSHCNCQWASTYLHAARARKVQCRQQETIQRESVPEFAALSKVELSPFEDGPASSVMLSSVMSMRFSSCWWLLVCACKAPCRDTISAESFSLSQWLNILKDLTRRQYIRQTVFAAYSPMKEAYSLQWLLTLNLCMQLDKVSFMIL